MTINKNKKWYWICYGPYENSIGFNCNEAVRSKIMAYATIAYRNSKEKVGKWFVKELFEHPDPDRKQFKCPECNALMSKKELDKTWDWSGPHCNNCGCTGMVMFGAIQDHAPVMSSKRD